MSFTREETSIFYGRSLFWGVGMFLIDCVLLSLCTWLALTVSPWPLQAVFSFLMGTVIASLFAIGHDAAHDSLTPHRGLNRLVGTIAFLPSMHPYSLWVKLHNLRHHMWTNLRGKDDVWVPLSPEEYAALPAVSRGLYRFYRSVYGPLLYYLIEFWWKKFSWPTRKHYDGVVKTEYVVDTLVTWAFAIGWIATLVHGAGSGWFGEGRPWWNAVLYGALLPFFIWNVYSGVSIYLHHTHPKIVWYRDEAEWRQVSKANTAVHAVFPRWVQRTFHFIQEHTAHHLRPSIPIYHLAEAQACLERKDDVDVVVYEWSAARHADIARRCKLYDYDAKRWLDFSGRFTSPSLSRKRVATPLSPDVLEAVAT